MNHLEWNNQDTFVLTDIYTPEGYALYRTKPEFAILADFTGITIPIRTYEDYQKYKDEIIRIEEMPRDVEIRNLKLMIERLWQFYHTEPTLEPDYDRLRELYPYINAIRWLNYKIQVYCEERIPIDLEIIELEVFNNLNPSNPIKPLEILAEIQGCKSVRLFELEELNSTDNLPEMVIEKYAEFKKIKRPVRLFRSDPAPGGINPDYLIIIGKPPGKFEKLCTGWLYNGHDPELSETDECIVSSDFKFRIVKEFF